MIDIADLEGKDSSEILGLIELEQSKKVSIYVPKSTQQFFSDSLAIANDYAMAAYSGQLLENISSFFTYEMISPTAYESIMFEIIFDDKEQLAEVLFLISCLYDINELPDEDSSGEPLIAIVGQFLYEIEQGDIIPACPYFIEVANEFNEDND